MKKWIFSSALFLCASFSNNPIYKHNCADHNHPQMMIDSSALHAPKVLDPSDSRFVDPDTIQADYLAVKPMQIDGFEGDSLKKMEKAFEALEKVVNSKEFKNRVINFKNDTGVRSFASNQGLSNEKIYSIFMSGREILQQDTPHEMNFFLKLYYKRYSKVIGWTNGDINTININWKFFKNFKPNDVAGNLAHEWTHKIGFDHRSAAEHDSAPYAIGYIVREMGERYLKGEELY